MELRHTCAYIAAFLFVLPSPVLAQQRTNKKSESTTRAPPKQLPDDWKGLKQIPTSRQRVWSAKDESGFGLGVHHDLAKNSTACSEQLVAAQYRQDIKKQFDATAHFDNCAFEGSFQALDAEIAGIDKILTAPSDKKAAAQEAMSHIGRMLHAVQDFYAHTNWVELQHAADAPFNDTLVVPVWTEEGRKRALDTKNLLSGYVWWSHTANQCASDKLTHELIAKDSASTQSGKAMLPKWNRTAYSAAFTLAQQSTGQLLQWAYAKWPLLKEQCGEELYVVGTPDRRPQ